jgi:CubicO group peptidase (beta-lactamase class C family)
MAQLRSGTPEDAGISPERLQLILELCQGWVAVGSTPALVVLAARRGIIFLHEAWGQLGPEPDSPPVLRDSLFGVASVSKPVTATAVMMLVERGKIGINQPVQKYLPGFRGEGYEEITVRHLLTHTSGLPSQGDVALFETGRAGIRLEPGREMAYSNVAYDLLGEIVQRVSGQSFDDFTRQYLFEPLGMKDATFIHPGKVRERCIRPRAGTTYDWPDEVNGKTEPSSTLWATAMDMAIFAQTFLNRGIYGDFRLLSPATVAAMTRNQVPGIPREMIGGIVSPPCGFGWFMLDEVRFPNTPCLWSPQSYGHSGGSGAFLWVDPAYELVGVFFFTKLREEVRPLDLFVDTIMGAIVEK